MRSVHHDNKLSKKSRLSTFRNQMENNQGQHIVGFLEIATIGKASALREFLSSWTLSIMRT